MSITINPKLLHRLSFSVDEIEWFHDHFPKGLEITRTPELKTVVRLTEALDTHKLCVQFFGHEDPRALSSYCDEALVYSQRVNTLRQARSWMWPCDDHDEKRQARDRAALRRAHKNAALDLAWIGWRHLATWGGP